MSLACAFLLGGVVGCGSWKPYLTDVVRSAGRGWVGHEGWQCNGTCQGTCSGWVGRSEDGPDVVAAERPRRPWRRWCTCARAAWRPFEELRCRFGRFFGDRLHLAPITRSAPMSWNTCNIARNLRSCAIPAESPSESRATVSMRSLTRRPRPCGRRVLVGGHDAIGSCCTATAGRVLPLGGDAVRKLRQRQPMAGSLTATA